MTAPPPRGLNAGMDIIDCIPTEEAPGSRGRLPRSLDQPRSLQLKAAHRAALDAEAARVESLDEILPKPTSKPLKLMKVCM